MEFFLYEIIARVVAICFFIDGSRQLWNGLAERNFSFLSTMILWIFSARRSGLLDTAPFRYWLQIGTDVPRMRFASGPHLMRVSSQIFAGARLTGLQPYAILFLVRSREGAI
jgi:hypothetical protein